MSQSKRQKAFYRKAIFYHPIDDISTEIDACRIKNPTMPQRDQAYQSWLAACLGPAQGVKALFSWLEEYRGGSIIFRNHRRPHAYAIMQGVLTVADSDKFNQALLLGIGHHANRGYGMLAVDNETV